MKILQKWLIGPFLLLLFVNCSAVSGYNTLYNALTVPSVQVVVVAPFVNLSADPAASKIVEDTVASRMRAYGDWTVRDWKWMESRLLAAKIEIPGSLDRSTLALLAHKVGADAFLTGTIYEYGHIVGSEGVSKSGAVAYRIDLIHSDDNQVLWSASTGAYEGADFSPVQPALSYVTGKSVDGVMQEFADAVSAAVLERAAALGESKASNKTTAKPSAKKDAPKSDNAEASPDDPSDESPSENPVEAQEQVVTEEGAQQAEDESASLPAETDSVEENEAPESTSEEPVVNDTNDLGDPAENADPANGEAQ